jgi:ABC-type uncharacterized transport system involved in gliding motility auxiliary subunit
MDVNHQPMTVREADTLMSALVGSGVTLNLPLQILIPQEAMNRTVSITSHLSPLFYVWGSALDLHDDVLKKQQLTPTVLFSTSPHSWQIKGENELTAADLEPAAHGQERPLAVLVQGQFPDVYASKERPAWPEAPPGVPKPAGASEAPEQPAAAAKPAPGKLLVIGNAEMFHRNFLVGGNIDLFLNSVDALTLGDDLIHVRSKKQIDRTISKPSLAARQFWKFVNIGLVNILAVVLGIGGAIIRRRSRAAYTAAPHALV